MKKTIWLIYAYVKKYSVWLLYFLFFIFSLQIIRSSPEKGSKIFYALILVLVLGIVLYYEFLKHLYSQMIQALTNECNIPKAQTLKAKLEKYDFFKGFKQSIRLFETLLLLDSGKYQACLEHLHKHTKFFHGTLDYLAIYYYSQMKCYAFLADSEQALTAIKKLKHLKHVNQKNGKLSGLFAWEEVDAFQYELQGRNQKSLAALEEVPLNRLNPREQTYYYYEKMLLLQKLQRPQAATQAKKAAKELGNTLFIVQ